MGFVGLGSVKGSQKTTPLDVLSLEGLSFLFVPDRMELCETPVEGAFEINEAAEDVAAWRIGLLIKGLPA